MVNIAWKGFAASGFTAVLHLAGDVLGIWKEKNRTKTLEILSTDSSYCHKPICWGSVSASQSHMALSDTIHSTQHNVSFPYTTCKSTLDYFLPLSSFLLHLPQPPTTLFLSFYPTSDIRAIHCSFIPRAQHSWSDYSMPLSWFHAGSRPEAAFKGGTM